MSATAVGPTGVAQRRADGTTPSYSIWGHVPLALVCVVIALALTGWTPRAEADPPQGLEAPMARLRHPEAARRRAAAAALVETLRSLPPAARAIYGGVLESALRAEDDPGVGVNLVGALGRVGGAATRPALRGLLGEPLRGGGVPGQSQPLSVRGAAVRALGVAAREPDPGAVASRPNEPPRDDDVTVLAALAGAEGDDDPVAALAVRALAELTPARFLAFTRAAERDPRRRVAWLRAAALRGDPRLPSVARRVLEAGRPEATMAAALGAVATMRVTELAGAVLAVAQEHPARSLRRQAVRALGRLGGGFDPAVLGGLLDDPITAEPALACVRSLGVRSLAPRLLPWLDRPLASDRRAAAELLGSFDDPALHPALLARAAAETDPEVRGALWRALAGAEGGALAVMARHPDPGARDALAGRVWRGQSLDGAPLPPRGAGHDVSTAVIRAALGAPWDPRDLQGPSPAGRLAAAVAGGVVRDRTRCEALAVALGREDHDTVRVALVLSLARQGCPAAWEALGGLVRAESAAPSDAALAALGALVDAGEPVDPEIVVGWTRDDDDLTRLVAVYTLGRTGGPGAVGALRARMGVDPEARVRGAAAVALARRVGVEALGDIETLGGYAWTPGLVDLLGRAAAVARAGAEAPGSPRTVVALDTGVALGRWILPLADGGVTFGVTDGRGVGRIETDRVDREGLPEARGPVQRRSIP